MDVYNMFLFLLSFVGVFAKETFRGAVFEHRVIFPENPAVWVNRSVALRNMMKNIAVYEQQAIKAGQQNVDILVFPECGILGAYFTRDSVQSYLEYIPDPEKEFWNPCAAPDRYENTEIQHSLSCMAKSHNLYVVANMGDFQPCSKSTDPDCPDDGHYQFNTAVVYNSTGFLIARYHKINLYYEYQYDFPPHPKAVTFETPFGKFGVMICFDAIFKNPSITLTEELNVGNIVFPTAWMDALPYFSSIQFHSAFAAGTNVNFLAANIKYPERRFHGSGIYSPKGSIKYFYTEDHSSKLLVADIPVNWKQTKVPHNTFFQAKVRRDLYNLRSISDKEGQSKICHGDLCCYLTYEMKDGSKETFAFAAYDGLHKAYYLQVCLLLKCPTDNITTCGQTEKSSNTNFKYIHVNGTFTSLYVFPEILLSDKNNLLHLASPSSWKYQNNTLESKGLFKLPVLSFGMLGRVYSKDKPRPSKWSINP